jgi:hypothetical protein
MVTSRKLPSALRQSWHAVSVVGAPEACPAAGALRQQRFLSAEAPRLPLAECSSPGTCKCRYIHYTDRRAFLRREADRGGLPMRRAGKELRVNPLGRRASDKE